MPEDNNDTRKKIQDVWGATLSGDELPGQSIKPAAATQILPTGGAESEPLPTIQLGARDEGAPSRGVQIEILDVVGEGGMGTIYRARQKSLDREIALKRIKPRLEKKQEVVDMFLGEAHATGALDHPNIVPVYELGRDDKGRVFYSMKLVHGTSWDKLLHPETDEQRARAESMSVRDHLDILLKVCDAIGFAHSRGVIHRDLKPENVMVGEYGEVLVMDWGLAATSQPGLPATKRLPDVRKVTTTCGTPNYMPPEMALGEGYRTCAASDVYLLGGLLFEILFGKPPHEGETVWMVLLAASENKIAKPGKTSPEARSYYQALKVTLNKAFNVRPAKRQTNARVFGEDVRAALAHFDSLAMATDAHERVVDLVDELGGEAKGATPARARKLYAGFAEAVAGLKQSLRSWPENPFAGEWLDEAHVEYARLALAMNDFALAQAQIGSVDTENDAAGELRHDIRHARKQAAARERSAKLMRWGLSAAAAVVFVVVTTAFFWIRSEQKNTEAALVARNVLAKEAAPEFLAKSRRHTGKGRFDDALAAIDIAIGLDDSVGNYYVQKGFILQDLFRFSDSKEAFTRAAERGAPEKVVEANLKLSDEMLKLARDVKARTGVDVESYPSFILLAFAKALDEQKRYAEAAQAYAHGGTAGDAVLKRWHARLKAHGPSVFKDEGELATRLKVDDALRVFLNLTRIPDLVDLEFVRGMPLYSLVLFGRQGEIDLSPLQETPIEILNLSGSLGLKSLSALKGCKLTQLDVSRCRNLKSLDGLQGMPLEKLNLGIAWNTENGLIESLESLRGMKLKWLSLQCQAKIKSLAPLRGMPLEHLTLGGCRSLKTLDGLQGMALDKLDLPYCTSLADISALEGMQLRELMLPNCNKLTDISALKGMPLTKINLARRPIRSLDGLQGMKLKELDLGKCKYLADISALKGMPLENLSLQECIRLTDISALEGMQLKELNLGNCNKLGDISALKGMPLEKLNMRMHWGQPNKVIKSLESLRGMKLKWLELMSCHAVESLAPLEGMPIEHLLLRGCASLKSLDGLQGMRLKMLDLHGCNSLADISALRGMPLTTLNLSGKPLKSLDGLQGMQLKVLDLRWCNKLADISQLEGMPLEKLDLSMSWGKPNKLLKSVESLRGMKLKWLNLQCCPMIESLAPLEGMPLTYLGLGGHKSLKSLDVLQGMPLDNIDLDCCTSLADISALKGMPLTRLNLGMKPSNEVLKSLEDLRGLKLKWLSLARCLAIENLAPLKDMPLEYLNLAGFAPQRFLNDIRGIRLKELNLSGCNDLADISLLKGMPLEKLNLGMHGMHPNEVLKSLEGLRGMKLKLLNIASCTAIESVAPLRGMPLTELSFENTGTTDLTPLAGMKLKTLSFTAEKITKGLDVVRKMKSISQIRLNWHSLTSPVNFWKKFDAAKKKRDAEKARAEGGDEVF